MMGMTGRLVLLFIFTICVKSWFLSQHRVCDSTGEQLIPFSGFKIHRKYVVKRLQPPMLHFVTLSHCENGSLDYERLSSTGRETDIEWNKPICMFEEPKLPKKHRIRDSIQDQKTRVLERENLSLAVQQVDPPKKHYDLLEEVPKKPHSIKINDIKNLTATASATTDKHLKRSHRKEGTSHMTTFNDFMRKLLSKYRYIEYKDQDSLVINYEDLNLIDYHDYKPEDLNNLKCYKLARRKKYAKRQLIVYAPYTWVGGLFECDISQEAKVKFLESLQDKKPFVKPYELKCERNSSRALFPLLADDVSSQWIEREKGTTLSQRIPYLYTPGILDARYGKPARTLGRLKGKNLFEGHDLGKKLYDAVPLEKWEDQVEVNEEYEYSKEDIDILTRTITSTTNLFNQFLLSDNKLKPWDWDLKELIGNDNEGVIYLEHKFLSVMGRIHHKNIVTDFIDNIQQSWDNLTLSAEQVFKYNS